MCVRVRELAHMRVYAKKIKYKSKEKWDHVIGFTGVKKKENKKERKKRKKEKWDHVIGFTGGSSFGHVRLTAPVVDGGKEVVCG